MAEGQKWHCEDEAIDVDLEPIVQYASVILHYPNLIYGDFLTSSLDLNCTVEFNSHSSPVRSF